LEKDQKKGETVFLVRYSANKKGTFVLCTYKTEFKKARIRKSFMDLISYVKKNMAQGTLTIPCTRDRKFAVLFPKNTKVKDGGYFTDTSGISDDKPEDEEKDLANVLKEAKINFTLIK